VEPQRDETPAPTAPAANLMFNLGGLLKNVTNCNSFFTFPIHIFNDFNHTKIREKVASTLRLIFVCFQKVGLLYSRAGVRARAGAGFAAAP
jgi:hypothetical protein